MAAGFARAMVIGIALQLGLAGAVFSTTANAAGGGPGVVSGVGSAVGTAEARAIRATVQRQLDAFDRDDAAAAFAQASRAARDRFGTAERFMAMVRQQYQAVYRRRSVIFSEVERIDGVTIQSVRVTDADDRVWVAVYQMQQESDGQWRILGCQLLETRSVST